MTRLREIAHARTGDKGDTLNVCVFAVDDAAYQTVTVHLTEDRVAEQLAHLSAAADPPPVTRHELPTLNGCNFVVDGVLNGGVTVSLRQDGHGKTLSTLILDIDLPVE